MQTLNDKLNKFNPRNNEQQATKEDGEGFWNLGKEFKALPYEDEKRITLHGQMVAFLKTFKGNQSGQYGPFLLKVVNGKLVNGRLEFNE